MKKTIGLILALAMALSLALTACGQTDGTETAPTTPATSPAVTNVVATTATTTAATTTAPTTTATTAAPATEATPTPTAVPTPDPGTDALPQAAAGVNTLTGLPIADPARQNLRPVAIMINNLKIATPQIGISAADLYYEMVVEGGITRMLAAFADPAGVPEIGSVRSARHDYIDLAGGLDAIFVHAGGSYAAYDQIKAQKTDSIDMMSSSAFWRDPTWARTRGQEHSVRTNGSRLSAAIASKKMRATFKDAPLSAFRFLDTPAPAADPAASPAATVGVTFSKYTTATFRYDPATKRYTKHQFGGPQMDIANNQALKVTNIVVLRTTIRSFEGTILRDANLGSGSGYYISNGARTPIKWQKGATAEPLILLNEDGTPLLVNRGKTFICIQDSAELVTFG